MSPRSRVFAVANQKGGVAKTTTAVNLAASFAVSERRTLLVDVDPQANATSGLGVTPGSTQIYDALIGACGLKDVLQPTELEYLQVAPAGPDLVGAEIELVTAEQRERRLARVVEEVRADYELVVIDCPPSLGILTLNALAAADSVIVPLQAEYYALEGLARLLDTIERVREGVNPRLELEGVLLTMMDARNNLSRQVADEVRGHLGARVFQTEVPRNVRLSEAPSHGRPALLYDVRSKGAVAYLRVAEEILRRLEGAEASIVPAAVPDDGPDQGPLPGEEAE